MILGVLADLNNDRLIDVIWAHELSINLNNKTLSIDDEIYNRELKVFPNPISNVINIETKFKGDLFIHSGIGQLVYKKLNIPIGTNKFKLNLPSQVYLLSFKTKTGIINKKI